MDIKLHRLIMKTPLCKITLVLCATGLLFLFCACSGDSDRYTPEGEREIAGDEILQSGIASWYGPGFDGRLTSSRDRFDKTALTAAHRTLPFNTIVEVVNLENDKSVEVRINDRGPYHRNRIIDLSMAAAEEIGMIDSGTAEVDLILIEPGGPLPEDLNRPTFTIQVGEYNRVTFAERFAESVGDGVRIEQRFSRDDRIIYMIFYGSYNSMSAARQDLARLEARGFEGLIRQID
jgi:rare lipoprotein A